jgi:aldehyde dehydrogenase (NAD+)
METLFNAQRDFFNSHQTLPVSWRKAQLLKLKTAIETRQGLIQAALKADLNKSEFEAYSTEIGYVIASINFTLKRLDRWAKRRRVKTPLTNFPSQSFIQPEPLGNVLLIGPFNYPFQLVIEPLIGALAAGNTAIVKPSEFVPHTAQVLEDLIRDTFDPAYVHVVQGDASVTQALIQLPFNHIFFTGSTRVGQAVYRLAAERLTPVTLELGGKSPTIVDETADLRFAARRIVFGKFINAGQTCIAPDYIYVHRSVKDAFIEALKAVLDTHQEPKEAFTRIVHDGHMQRLLKLIDPKKVVYSRGVDVKARYLSAHLIDGVEESDPIMQEEIFGPLLPLLSYESLDDLIELLKTKDRPLALYLFSESKENQEKVFTRLSFGNGAINDTLMQVSNPHLPFGGVGPSGLGAYHGKASFDRFSHTKSFVKRYKFFDPDALYPPYSANTMKLVKRLLK